MPTDTCPACSGDRTAYIDSPLWGPGADAGPCATCSGTGQVQVCCERAEAEAAYPMVEADDWTIVCPVHVTASEREQLEEGVEVPRV